MAQLPSYEEHSWNLKVHWYGFSSIVILEQMAETMIWYSILTIQDHTLVTGSDELAHNNVANQLLLPPTYNCGDDCLPIQLCLSLHQ